MRCAVFDIRQSHWLAGAASAAGGGWTSLMTSGSSSARLRHGEIQAANVSANAHSPSDFEKVLVAARELTKEACPSVFVPALQTACAGAGVVVVFTPELKGCGVSGVTRWLSSGHALIQLSLRYKTDDHLWFTFFHEAGHVLLHPKKRTVFLDGDGGSGSPDQDDANRFATDHLLRIGRTEPLFTGRPRSTPCETALLLRLTVR